MTEIRSYRRVFDLERRIYRIDSFRLNPGGVPLRGVAYLLACVALVAVIAQVPPAAQLLALLPWYARFIVLPSLVAGALAMIRIEGRSFHLAAFALVRRLADSRRLIAFRPMAAPRGSWQPSDLLLIPDGSEREARRMRYTGPGLVVARGIAPDVVLEVGAGARVVLPPASGRGER